MPAKKTGKNPKFPRKLNAFLRQRLDFHSEGFEAAKAARNQAVGLRKKETRPERRKLLTKAADDLTGLANWHKHRVGKLYKRKKRLSGNSQPK